MLAFQTQRRLLAATGYAELELFQEAVSELAGITAPDNQSVPVLAIWLNVYQGWSKWTEAIAVANHLIQQDPDQSAWYVGLAYATRRATGLGSAREILLLAAGRFPDSAIIQFNLACYEAQLGALDKSRTYLARAIALDPSFAELAVTDPDLEPLKISGGSGGSGFSGGM
jgi:tetratricopeptide (TPR) repeat protein